MNTPSDTLQQALTDLFAPWVQALNLKVERTEADSVTLRLPQSEQLSRVGGMLCGQAMMAAADTAMVLALIQHFGQFRPCSTCPGRTRWSPRGCCGQARPWPLARSTWPEPTTARAFSGPAPPMP